MKARDFFINVNSEISTLRRVMIHSPDNGLGKVVPSKAQDWLFEDIIDLDAMRRQEYDLYIKILLYFLDQDKVAGKIKTIDSPENDRLFYKPNQPLFHNSTAVVEFQQLLFEILENSDVKAQLVAAVCAYEKCTWNVQKRLLDCEAVELARVLISGSFLNGDMIFPPVPNLIFTRDIGIVINDHILLNRAATLARARESLLGRYVFYNHPVFAAYHEKIIELSESIHYFLLPEGENDFKKTTLEGGDIMMIGPRHLLIGVSERTSSFAANQIIKAVFSKNLVDKVTVLKIPRKRAYMHIDTIFTQVARDIWVLLGSLGRRGDHIQHEGVYEQLMESKPADQLKIMQFSRLNEKDNRQFEFLEDLLEDISKNDLQVKTPIKFVYSGGNVFPYDAREQWTDSCNLLVIKEGVAIGYDRNKKTAEAFRKAGFKIYKAGDLLDKFEKKELSPENMQKSLILLPSAELSRARGGSHCMSLPLNRDAYIPE